MMSGWWHSLETLPLAAVKADWQRELGEEFALASPFLKPTGKPSEDFPCTNHPRCECMHQVGPPGRRTGFMATCGCGCPPIFVEPQDLVVLGLNVGRLCSEVCAELGFHLAVSSPVNGVAWSYSVGAHGAARSPVFLTFARSEDSLLIEIEGLIAVASGPFVLLAPTDAHCTPRVNGVLRRNSCTFIPLSSALALGPRGKFVRTNPIDELLSEFDRALVARGAALAKTVERIDRSIEAVALNQYELRKENEELRQLNKDGYFNFAVRVKGDDFLAFAVIMALGNRKAAADHLKIPHRTFYNRVDQWESRGKEYQLMVRYMDWRKRSSRHLKVQLNPSLQSGDAGDQAENPETLADVLTEIKAADNKDYPAMLAEILQALERQNAGNWTKVRQELVEMIKEDVMQ